MAAASAEEELCCISHAFDRAARRDFARLSVIHAAADASADNGERRFTCGDLLSAVSSLSRRIADALRRPPPGDDGAPGACVRGWAAACQALPICLPM
jgi:acyl-CoA synthetase